MRYSYVSDSSCPFGDIYLDDLASEQVIIEMAGQSLKNLSHEQNIVTV